MSRLALKFGWYDNKSRVAQEIKRTLMCSTLFCTFFCRCCRNVKLPSYTFYGENVVCVPKKILLLVFLFAFFFLPHSFSPCWALAFLIFFLLFFLSLLPFFSLSFASLSHTTFTFSLSLWVDMTINVAEYFKQPRYRNNFRFSLCLYWLFYGLCFTRHGWPCDFSPKNLELHLGCHTCWLSYFTLACLWCGRKDGWTYGHVTTSHFQKFSDA